MSRRLERVSRELARARRQGWHETAQRFARRAARKLDVSTLDFPLLPGDEADSRALTTVPPRATDPDRPLTVGWLTTPPAAGSGGHTTMFRMVQGLERAGHRCVILLYDRHGGDIEHQARVIRESWPWVRAEVAGVDEGLSGVDACVATGWETAHVLASRGAPVHRLYFVQDYEPFFYPHGSLAELAADSYRFGFTTIALGHMVSDRLHSEVGVTSHLVPFSCDTEVYALRNTGTRSGVAFYTKPDNPRRGFTLGIRALEEFHRRHPDQPIHLYGQPIGDPGFPVVQHARLSPDELNELYNGCAAGLAMSFTNISLVAEEMLAAGCVPVVNDSRDSRADLDNAHVAWALPTPTALADALSAVVTSGSPDRSAAAAASVRDDNWQLTAGLVASLVETTVRGAASAKPPRV